MSGAKRKHIVLNIEIKVNIIERFANGEQVSNLKLRKEKKFL